MASVFKTLFSSEIADQKEDEHDHDEYDKEGSVKTGLENIADQFAALHDDA